MSGEQIDCGIHGMQPLTFACTHIAHGLLDGTTSGFVSYPEVGEAYPLAWCEECEVIASQLEDGWTDDFRRQSDFKMLCASCYLEGRDLARDAGRLRIY